MVLQAFKIIWLSGYNPEVRSPCRGRSLAQIQRSKHVGRTELQGVVEGRVSRFLASEIFLLFGFVGILPAGRE